MGRTSGSQCTWLSTWLGRRNGQTCNYVLIHVLWLMIGWMVRDLEGNLVTNKFGEVVYRPPWIGEKKLKIFVFHVSAHQRVTSAEEDFSHLVDRKTGSVDTRQSLSPATPGLMNKVAMVAGMEVLHGLSNMDFHSPMPSWVWPLLSAQSSSNRDQHWAPVMAPFPRVISQLPGDRLITLDGYHHGRSRILFLLE